MDRSLLLAEIDRSLADVHAPLWGKVTIEVAIQDGQIVRVDTDVRRTRIPRDALDETSKRAVD